MAPVCVKPRFFLFALHGLSEDVLERTELTMTGI